MSEKKVLWIVLLGVLLLTFPACMVHYEPKMSGVVVDADNQKPIRDAQIVRKVRTTCYFPPNPGGPNATGLGTDIAQSDADGHYEIPSRFYLKPPLWCTDDQRYVLFSHPAYLAGKEGERFRMQPIRTFLQVLRRLNLSNSELRKHLVVPNTIFKMDDYFVIQNGALGTFLRSPGKVFNDLKVERGTDHKDYILIHDLLSDTWMRIDSNGMRTPPEIPVEKSTKARSDMESFKHPGYVLEEDGRRVRSLRRRIEKWSLAVEDLYPDAREMGAIFKNFRFSGNDLVAIVKDDLQWSLWRIDAEGFAQLIRWVPEGRELYDVELLAGYSLYLLIEGEGVRRYYLSSSGPKDTGEVFNLINEAYGQRMNSMAYANGFVYLTLGDDKIIRVNTYGIPDFPVLITHRDQVPEDILSRHAPPPPYRMVSPGKAHLSSIEAVSPE